MKKFFTLLVALVATMTCMAQTTTEYVGNIEVGVDGSSTTLDNVSVFVIENTDGTYSIELRDFSFGELYVGNIVVPTMQAKKNADGTITLTSDPEGLLKNNIEITGSDIADLLGNGVRGSVKATIKGNTLVLDLPLNIMGMTILVHFEGTSTSDNINMMTTDAKPTVAYNVAGQIADDNAKGIIIRNGKKYMK